MPAVSVFPQRRSVAYVVPAETAHMIAERAGELWGAPGGDGRDRPSTTIVVWHGRRGMLGLGAAPTGAFSIAWNQPASNQASITRIEWDPGHGGTEDAIRRAINHLAGWPVARELALS